MKNSLPQLCKAEKCTACTACMNSCAKCAISMQENAKGELHPVLDIDKCIRCGVCEKVCPELNNSLERNSSPTVYCCWLKDAECRKESTSGGAAFAISKAVIERGGHVWGAAYTDCLSPVYLEANTIDELRRIQKSKYVQCAPRDCFRKIREELKNGDLVLFTGTSCHVKGLLSFLCRDYENLLTVDLVCHGVPGQGVFRKYKEYLERKYDDKLNFFTFRPKRESDGQEFSYCTVANFDKEGSVKIQKKENGYFVGFQNSIFLRECCFNCQGNGMQRYADFTVADFWGLGKVKPFLQWQERTKGISMLALNSGKARDFFDLFKDDMVYELRSIEEACFSNHPYDHSTIKPPKAEAFWKEWQLLPWEELNRKYFRTSQKEQIMYYIKRFTSPYLLAYIKFIVKWIK